MSDEDELNELMNLLAEPYRQSRVGVQATEVVQLSAAVAFLHAAEAADSRLTAVMPEIVVITDSGQLRYRVKENAIYYLEVIPMLLEWRLHTVRKSDGPLACTQRYWDYAGKGRASFVRAILAAHAWDGAGGSEPQGWNWNGQTREWKETP
jgi:hypothetical protein